MTVDNVVAEALDERRLQHRLRKLRCLGTVSGAEVTDGARTLINFASNDYLGLSQNERLKARASEFVQLYGTGLASSRLLSGNLFLYDEIEAKIAAFKGTEAALLLPTGFQTNSTVVSALARTSKLFLADEENHNSIFHGLKSTRTPWRRYGHNDLNQLGQLLDSASAKNITPWILTESVFSMDGSTTDINRLAALSTAHGASLYVDEAHATGILGTSGQGLSHGIGGVDISMGTFSKALGSFGAYIACTKLMREYLINFCGGLIYSTALPPAVLGAIDAALDLVPELDLERDRLKDLCAYSRAGIESMGFVTNHAETPIIPIFVGSDRNSVDLAEHLESNGLFAPAIRPPTVPEGTARIRLSLTCHHSKEHVDRLFAALKRWSAHD